MKIAIVLVAMLAASSAYADFDKEFASFDKDFARLDAMFAKKRPPKQVVVAKASGAEQALKMMDKDIVEPTSTRAQLREQNEVDPKSPDRVGYQIEDPVMREKVTKLYQKPDIRVYSYVLQAE